MKTIAKQRRNIFTGTTEADRVAWMEFSPVIPVSAGKTPRWVAGELKFTFA